MLRFKGPVNPMGSCCAQSVYLTTLLLGRISLLRRLTSIVHIFTPETDNCPSWISWRKRMTIENISWSISMKECCQPVTMDESKLPERHSGAKGWTVTFFLHLSPSSYGSCFHMLYFPYTVMWLYISISTIYEVYCRKANRKWIYPDQPVSCACIHKN